MSCGDSRILNGYRSMMGVAGLRSKAHTGVDFRGHRGDEVVAAAPGVVLMVLENAVVGRGVLLGHGLLTGRRNRLYSVYLHLSNVSVAKGAMVERGEKIGEIGATGFASGGVAHLHFQVCSFPCSHGTTDGDFDGVIDPLKNNAGCVVAGRVYDDLTLTYPIRC